MFSFQREVAMGRLLRFAQLALAAALTMASTQALALDANQDGTWTGTIKCDTRVQDPVSTHLNITSTVTVRIFDGDSVGVVCNRFAGLGGPDFLLYLGAYIPDSPTATKGTLGFASDPLINYLPYVETGQSRLEKKSNGSVTLNGKSFVLAESPDGAVTASCEWKLNKFADTQELPPSPFPLCD
jgi:hypothetical protein